ncbi:MAG TPA: hypothetical protein VG944_01450 [Fimbriimonas sp.]|nr:hypothetical protein [Fimbriimonas sp.]
MDGDPPRRRALRASVLLPAICLVPLAVGWTKYHAYREKEDSKNFQPHFVIPGSWKAMPHGPQTLFKYQDPSNRLIFRGAVNQIISPVNPTPELDTDGIAQFYIDRTEQSMPGWTAAKAGVVNAKGLKFDLIRRERQDRIVVTAYAVRGNTTLLITLFGLGKAKPFVDSNMPEFQNFLQSFSLNEKDMSDL